MCRIRENYTNTELIIDREEGIKVDYTKMQGSGKYDVDSNTFTFTKSKERIKTNTKNPVVYGGDHISIRPQKQGGYRATIMIPSNANYEELKVCLTREIVDGLNEISK